MNFNLYQGGKKRTLPDARINNRLNDPAHYIPSTGLANAVNMALHLNLPLLVTGEPGSGKTLLAHHVAYTFDLGHPLVFNTQTDSAAKDLFYQYDGLGHFQFSQNQREMLGTDEVEARFIRYQALGAAIRSQGRKVVLIDEVDKAPRDFPNNILAALESLEFDVPEIGKRYGAQPENLPIVIMTSNSEKNLPDAFLRRVVFYHIPFPSEEQLLQILKVRTQGFNDEELRLLIGYFANLRGSRALKLSKPPATAELLYWVIALQKMDFPAYKLQDLKSLDRLEREMLRISHTVLVKNAQDMAFIAENMDRIIRD